MCIVKIYCRVLASSAGNTITDHQLCKTFHLAKGSRIYFESQSVIFASKWL